MMVDHDIEAIIARGEERTAVLNQKYEGLNLDDLSNFKSENMIQTWEGEDFQNKVCLHPTVPTLKITLPVHDSVKQLA
jgi:hypothetical protein